MVVFTIKKISTNAQMGGRQFIENPRKIYISEDTKNWIDKLL
jgi:hypothetical protein